MIPLQIYKIDVAEMEIGSFRISLCIKRRQPMRFIPSERTGEKWKRFVIKCSLDYRDDDKQGIVVWRKCVFPVVQMEKTLTPSLPCEQKFNNVKNRVYDYGDIIHSC